MLEGLQYDFAMESHILMVERLLLPLRHHLAPLFCFRGNLLVLPGSLFIILDDPLLQKKQLLYGEQSEFDKLIQKPQTFE